MQQLSGLDATFLYIETPEMPMHVGALHLLELPAGYKGKFVTALRQHMALRLPAALPLRRKLWWMPLNLANPAWVDAEPDLKAHIVESKLPASAKSGDGLDEIEAEVGRLHVQLLDRKRPLWKFHVFEGLGKSPAGLRRVALYTQLHHAAVDGQAAVALANAILDLSAHAAPPALRPSKRTKVFRLDMSEMLRGALAGQAQKVARIIRELPATVGTLRGAASKAISASALLGGKKGVSNLTLAPRTPLNLSVTAGRAFASVTLPLREFKDLGRAHEASINDLVLMVCSTALRRYYAKRHMLPRKSMVAAVPISLRAAGDTTADNQASMSLISLGTNIADPLKRLAHVRAATKAMKSTMGDLKSVLPTDFPSLGVPWLMEAAASLYGRARVADRLPQVANVVISNVPGPPVPLFMAGAQLLTMYPTSIVVHGLALNITVQSYNQSLDFGLMADLAAMPDVRELADAITIAFDDLRALPRPDEVQADNAVAEGVIGRTRRNLSGAVTGMVSEVVSGAASGSLGRLARKAVSVAVGGAVAQVTKARPSAAKTKTKAPAERMRGG